MSARDKGISPLIAAVILIALVVALAGMAGPWLQTFLRNRISEVEDIAGSQVECMYASFDYGLEDVEYEEDLSSNLVNITIDNGNEKLYNFTVHYVISGKGYNSEVIKNQPTQGDPLQPGSRTVLVTEIQNSTSLKGEELESVRVSTLACPSIDRKCNFIEEYCR